MSYFISLMLQAFLTGKIIFLGNDEGPFCGTVDFLLQSSKKIYVTVLMSFMYWKTVTTPGCNPSRSCVYDN